MQFDRAARIEIGPAGKDGLAVKHLRIRFEVEKSIKPGTNTAKFTIYNLAEGSRTRMQEQYQRVALFAGYVPEGTIPLVFDGDVDDVVHRVAAPEWVSEIRCGDGRKKMRETRISLSLSEGCSIGQVCKAIAKNLDVPIADEDELDDLGLEFGQGFSFSGPAEDALRRAAAAAGMTWFIDAGVLHFVPLKGTRNVQAIEISPESGLIDAPERLVRPKDNLKTAAAKQQWTCRCLLNGRLEPGMPVVLRSATAKGTFRVDTLRHVGDTHGDEWYTELEVGAYGAD